MGIGVLLHWSYLIFLTPAAIAGLMLLLSALQSHGHDVGHVHVGHVHIGHGGASGHGHSGSDSHSASQNHHGDTAQNHSSTEPGVTRGYASPAAILTALSGVGKVPLPMVLETFCMVWGISGCIANQALLPNIPNPNIAQVAPSIWIALACGLVGGRLATEAISLILPKDLSQAVSKDSLYGLTGKVAFKISATGGRALIYDAHGTLHDETCRVAQGQLPIEKERSIIVVDRDSQGNLVVEEIQN